MKITKTDLRNKHRKDDNKEKLSFKQWVARNGKELISDYKNKSETELDFTDEALKLLQDFI